MKWFIMFVMCSLVINSVSLVRVFSMKALTACFSCLCIKKQPIARVAPTPGTVDSFQHQLEECIDIMSGEKTTQRLAKFFKTHQRSADTLRTAIEQCKPDEKINFLHWVAMYNYTDAVIEVLRAYKNAGGNIVGLIEMQDNDGYNVLRYGMLYMRHYEPQFITTLLTIYHDAGGNIDRLVLGENPENYAKTNILKDIQTYNRFLKILEIITAYLSLGGDIKKIMVLDEIDYERMCYMDSYSKHDRLSDISHNLKNLLLVPGVNYSFLTILWPYFMRHDLQTRFQFFTKAVEQANTERPVLNAQIEAHNRALEASVQDIKTLTPVLATLSAQYCFKPTIQELPAGFLPAES